MTLRDLRAYWFPLQISSRASRNVGFFFAARSASTGARWVLPKRDRVLSANSPLGHPTAQSPRGGDPGGARRKALVTADASARERAPVRGHPLAVGNTSELRRES